MHANNPDDERCNDLQATLCDDGEHINVRNSVSGSGEVHTVEISNSGEVTGCTCKGFCFNDTCYHVDTVESSPLLLSSARAASASSTTVATDGGHERDDRFRLPEDPKHVSEEERDVVDVSRCEACSKLTTDKFCSDRCKRRGKIDETPL